MYSVKIRVSTVLGFSSPQTDGFLTGQPNKIFVQDKVEKIQFLGPIRRLTFTSKKGTQNLIRPGSFKDVNSHYKQLLFYNF
jgi:hypothetical protein